MDNLNFATQPVGRVAQIIAELAWMSASRSGVRWKTDGGAPRNRTWKDAFVGRVHAARTAKLLVNKAG